MTIKPIILVAAREWELRWRGRRIRASSTPSTASRSEPTDGPVVIHQSERFTGIMVKVIGDNLFYAAQQGFEEMNAALKLRAEAVSYIRVS